jgi:thiol-disulfide isomerase/thioredoxin
MLFFTLNFLSLALLVLDTLPKSSLIYANPCESQNFDEVVNGNQYALVEFYAPWSSFCLALQIEYLMAAAQLKYKCNNNAVMAKVDASSTPGGKALAARFNVTGFPTLIWFENGRPQPYTQNPGNFQDRSDLVFWVVSKTDDITQALTDQVCV